MLVGFSLTAVALAGCGQGRPNDYAQANWLTDPVKAIEAARQQGRPLFVAFLGSDWSTSSQGAIKEVLDTRAFKDLTDTQFVLLKVDFSRKGLTPEEAQGYASLAKQLQVDHFPLFLIADPAHGVGTFSRINTYGVGGPMEFVDQLTTIMTEYRQVLARRMAEMQAQGQAGSTTPPPALPRANGNSGYPSPQQMLQATSAQPGANIPAIGPLASPAPGASSALPEGFPSVQDMLKTPTTAAPAPNPAPAANTDGPVFQLK